MHAAVTPPSTATRPPPGWQADFADTPLFASVAGQATAFSEHGDWPTLDELNGLATSIGLRNAAERPVRFIAQSERLGQRGYEEQILRDGLVSTRMGQWHDLLNALVWLSFPHTKAALNALQCDELARSPAGRRSPLSDAATLFDESGLLLVSRSDEIMQLLRARRWREALFDRRDAWPDIGVFAIGHALLEKALQPFPSMTAKCLALILPDWPVGQATLDRMLAQAWQSGRVQRPADLFPLPVLGIPGLWQGNNCVDFYARQDIFRPA